MKKAFAKLLVSVVISFTCLRAHALSQTVDGITWSYTVSNGVATVRHVPEMTTGAITIPSKLGGYPVESIGAGAFEDCTNLTNVTIPNGVTSIGDDAFLGCSDLTSVTIPNSVTNIGEGAFSYCIVLANVTIPSSVTRIGEGAFHKCMGLADKKGFVIIRGVLHYYCASIGGKHVVIPTVVTRIGEAAFYESGITNLIVSSSVTSIGRNAFQHCLSLSAVELPDSVTSIVDGMFSDCQSLATVALPNSVTSIGNIAFDGCKALTSMTIPCGVTNIGDRAFSNCSRLKSIYFSGNAPHIGSYCFEYINANCVAYVPRVSFGWGVNIPGIWNGLQIEYRGGAGSGISDNPDLEFTSGGDGTWFLDGIAHNGMSVVRSGSISNNQESWLETSVVGPGTLSFWWKVSSEYDAEDDSVYDYAYLTVDGEDQGGLIDDYELFGYAIGGNTDWTNVEININGAGSHTVVWTYKKDEVDEIAGFEDCVWLENVVWRPMVSASFALGGGVGTVPASMGGLSGTPVTLPSGESFSRDGYVFDGWSDGMTKYAAGVAYTLPERNVTLTAQWIRKSILTFDLNGGQGAAPTAISNVPGTTVSLPSANGISKAKHTFAGWSDGNVTYAAGTSYTMSDSDVTFSVVWNAKTITTPTISSPQVSNGGVVTDTGSVTLLLSAGSGARIYYTLDGSVPTSASLLYEEPLTFTDYAVTIKAIALRDDYFDSDVAEFSFTRKPYTLAECLGLDNMDGVAVSASGDGEAWHRVGNGESHDGVAGLRSGAITHSQTNWVEVTTTGEGVLSFWWKASSESIRGKPRDGAMFYVDGVQIGDMLGGTTGDWEQRFYTAVGEGPHVFRWAYGKSATDAADVGEDCAWLDEVVWRSVVEPIEYENLRGASNTNPSTYYEGSRVAFADPGAVVGYSFAGWVPSEITPDMTGPQTIRANWTANRYSIAYDANGGSGEMSATEAEYDAGSTISQPTFSRPGYMATGWATNATGRVVYEAGQVVTNLTAQQGGVIRLYAVWVKNLAPEISVGGASAAMRCAAMPLGLRIALWNRFEQTTAAEPIPPVAVDAAPEVVTNAIEAAGFADAAAIKAAIGGEGAATKYAAFREWAGSVKGAVGSAGAASAAGEAAVVANTNAAAAWLLGAERLFDKQPTIGLEAVSVGRSIEDNDQGGGGLGTGQPTMTVSVVVRDGEDAVQCAAEKVRAMFEATSDLGDWDGTAKLVPAVTVEGNDGATMRFKVTPGDGASDRAFLRVKVK